MFGESHAPHMLLLTETPLRQRRYPKGTVSNRARLSSGFISQQIAARNRLRVLPARTRPRFFGGD